MAFVNEKLTPEQREEFNSWEVIQPHFGFGRIIREELMRNPWYWTIDKEREIYLLKTSYDRDFPNEMVFVFIWHKKNYLVQFFRSYEENNVIVWDIPKHYLIDKFFPYCEEEHFLDDLREALIAYGDTGTPNTWNEDCNTKFMF